MITTQTIYDNYQEVVITQWYCSYHIVLSFDVWLHFDRILVTQHDIKTHDSESRGQEEAAVRDERVSYLQVALLKNSQTL